MSGTIGSAIDSVEEDIVVRLVSLGYVPEEASTLGRRLERVYLGDDLGAGPFLDDELRDMIARLDAEEAALAAARREECEAAREYARAFREDGATAGDVFDHFRKYGSGC